jgi:hypothetical protein
MKKAGLLSILLLLGFTEGQERKPTPYPAMAPVEQYLIAKAQDEIALARSAAPPSISADAEVLVLGRHGYEGGPNCFNPAAARSVLPQYLRRTEWALTGIA